LLINLAWNIKLRVSRSRYEPGSSRIRSWALNAAGGGGRTDDTWKEVYCVRFPVAWIADTQNTSNAIWQAGVPTATGQKMLRPLACSYITRCQLVTWKKTFERNVILDMQTVKCRLHRRSCQFAVTGLERMFCRERNIEKIPNLSRFPSVRFICDITEMLISCLYVSNSLVHGGNSFPQLSWFALGVRNLSKGKENITFRLPLYFCWYRTFQQCVYDFYNAYSTTCLMSVFNEIRPNSNWYVWIVKYAVRTI
jgi:hypothetical protein